MKSAKEFNTIVMREIGLEINKEGNIVDQDTGVQLQFKEKNIKSENIRREDVAFDPLNNPKLMCNLFSYYTEKVKAEDDSRYISAFYPNSKEKGEKGCMELKEGSNTIKSGNYYNDSVKYADLILSLNGVTGVDLSEFDSNPNDNNIKRR